MVYNHIIMVRNHILHRCTRATCSKPSRNKTKPALCDSCYSKERRKATKRIKEALALAEQGTYKTIHGNVLPVEEVSTIISSYRKHNIKPKDIMRIYEIDRITLLEIISE